MAQINSINFVHEIYDDELGDTLTAVQHIRELMKQVLKGKTKIDKH